MQTFLPYPEFNKSAKCLDYRRLGKQRVETKQLLNVILNPSTAKGWKNHPAAKMWKGYPGPLAFYGYVICEEWINRGYKDSLKEFFAATIRENQLPFTLPPWLGNLDFHAAHRSNLLRKDKVYYSQFGWTESDDLPYIWPVA